MGKRTDQDKLRKWGTYKKISEICEPEKYRNTLENRVDWENIRKYRKLRKYKKILEIEKTMENIRKYATM